MHLDIGTGDGAFVYRSARAASGTFFIGVDANRDGLIDVSRRAASKPARGGVSNALFVHARLEQLPEALDGLASSLSILLPWGSLLRAVAVPEVGALHRLRRLCRAGAELTVLIGFDPARDQRTFDSLGIPPPTLEHLTGAGLEAFIGAGFEVKARIADTDEISTLPTTWAKKLVFGGTARRFFMLEGHAGP